MSTSDTLTDKEIKDVVSNALSEEALEKLISVKVIHISDDEKSKTVGELLTTKSHRDCIQTIYKNPMYVNQIHKTIFQRVSNVVHILKKCTICSVGSYRRKYQWFRASSISTHLIFFFIYVSLNNKS